MKKQDGGWFIKEYRAGEIGERTLYWVSESEGSGKRKAESEIRIREKNEKKTEREAARLINKNFSKGDILLGLDYDNKSYRKVFGKTESAEERIRAAEKEAEKLLRRVRRAAKKDGIEVRAMLFIGDMDMETKQPTRIHHHIIVNREAAKLFEKKWRYCKNADFEPLDGEDKIGLAKYLIGQRTHIKNAKAYTRTRNLKCAEAKVIRAEFTDTLMPPKGASVIFRAEYSVGINQYIRFRTDGGDKNKQRGTRTGSSDTVGNAFGGGNAGIKASSPHTKRRKKNKGGSGKV